MKKYYIEYRGKTQNKRKYITESEYKNIEQARKDKADVIYIPSIYKTERLNDFTNDYEYENEKSDIEKRELELEDLKYIKSSPELNLKSNFDEKYNYYKKNHNVMITRGLLFGIRKGIIGFSQGNAGYSISSNKIDQYYKIALVDEYFSKRRFAEIKNIEENYVASA